MNSSRPVTGTDPLNFSDLLQLRRNILNIYKPVTLNMKVGDVIRDHPELLDVLVAQSPHFKRLKNPVLRRIHGRFVTIAQAAAIAGIDPVSLVRNLNTAIGQDTPEQEPVKIATMAGTPPPPWLKTATIAVELDVREHQRRHEDPFVDIMRALAKVEKGQVLHLRNTFEPLPLYDVLGKKGFVPWAQQLGPEDWEVYFLKVGEAEIAAEAATTVPDDSLIEGEEPAATITVDVRELTPPQPMLRILDALDQLKPGETLLVHHVRRPVHLYPRLAQMGYTQKTVEKGPEQVDIYIRKAS